MAVGVLCPIGRRNAIGFTLRNDRGNRDRRLSRKLRLDPIERRVARRSAVTMAVGLNYAGSISPFRKD